MKASRAVAVASLMTVMLAGCTTPYGAPSNTGTGALVGGISGAGFGALVSHHDPAAGAAIGGVAGLITGALIGHSMDQARAPVYYAPPPPPPPPPGPRYVWNNGHWFWSGGAWVWVPGHWAIAY